eukprot:GHVR01123781.1.p1 GENE.GHVR01123781.1~~GHVR01123781.1.p1  ORF type:complete len:186 (+),score=48.68 GHVR01123781.1:665-1222(+)
MKGWAAVAERLTAALHDKGQLLTDGVGVVSVGHHERQPSPLHLPLPPPANPIANNQGVQARVICHSVGSAAIAVTECRAVQTQGCTIQPLVSTSVVATKTEGCEGVTCEGGTCECGLHVLPDCGCILGAHGKGECGCKKMIDTAKIQITEQIEDFRCQLQKKVCVCVCVHNTYIHTHPHKYFRKK